MSGSPSLKGETESRVSRGGGAFGLTRTDALRMMCGSNQGMARRAIQLNQHLIPNSPVCAPVSVTYKLLMSAYIEAVEGVCATAGLVDGLRADPATPINLLYSKVASNTAKVYMLLVLTSQSR